MMLVPCIQFVTEGIANQWKLVTMCWYLIGQAGLIEMPNSADLESPDFIYIFKVIFVFDECFTW